MGRGRPDVRSRGSEVHGGREDDEGNVCDLEGGRGRGDDALGEGVEDVDVDTDTMGRCGLD
jgi:hypothetical protein